MAKYTTYEQDQLEAILYYQWRIDKAYKELMKRHSKRSIVDKLNKVREGRANENRTNSIPTKA
jgi:hypothetical protein